MSDKSKCPKCGVEKARTTHDQVQYKCGSFQYIHGAFIEGKICKDNQIAQLKTLLVEASEDIAGWGAYAEDYFQEKWGLKKTVEKYRKAGEL
jgi:hypothetical protein